MRTRRAATRLRAESRALRRPGAAPRVVPFSRNPLLRRVVALYAAIWLALAIAPKYRSDWLLENLLVFGFAGALVATHRRFVLSNFSYVLIGAFLSLHAVGAWSTYAEAPVGFWLARLFDFDRNPYDRVVHFAFGLLLAYPVREIVLRRLRAGPVSAFLVPLFAMIAFSGAYEIVESWVARIVSPDLGTAWLGTQGDDWDAQKDMNLAMVGALISLSFAELHRRVTGRELWCRLEPPAPQPA